MNTEPVSQKRRVRAMFDSVAPRYDFLNHLLSAGIDRRWRGRAIEALALESGDLVLDLCAGTGDLGYEALRRGERVAVFGVDLAGAMLARGLAKRGEAPFLFVQGDAEHLPLPDRCMDRACVGFGIRNVASLDDALGEVVRVLRPGGRFVILEFTTPPNPFLRGLYHAYFHRLLPVVGGWVSGNPEAYAYLPDSVARFPLPPALAERMRAAGFREVTWRLLQGGIACIHLGVR